MSLYVTSEGYVRPIIICKCGGERTILNAPFPRMEATLCRKCGETHIINSEIGMAIMGQLVAECGPPPHLVTFDKGVNGVVTSDKT